MVRPCLPEGALQRRREPRRPATELRRDLGCAPAPVRGVDRAVAAASERIGRRVLDAPHRRVERRCDTKKARLERRV